MALNSADDMAATSVLRPSPVIQTLFPPHPAPPARLFEPIDRVCRPPAHPQLRSDRSLSPPVTL